MTFFSHRLCGYPTGCHCGCRQAARHLAILQSVSTRTTLIHRCAPYAPSHLPDRLRCRALHNLLPCRTPTTAATDEDASQSHGMLRDAKQPHNKDHHYEPAAVCERVGGWKSYTAWDTTRRPPRRMADDREDGYSGNTDAIYQQTFVSLGTLIALCDAVCVG